MIIEINGVSTSNPLESLQTSWQYGTYRRLSGKPSINWASMMAKDVRRSDGHFEINKYHIPFKLIEI